MGEIPLWKLKQEAHEYIAKCDAERGTGGLTMDIKTRIDNLTEAEAKAALYLAVKALRGEKMSEDAMMRKYAEAHGCGYTEVPIRKTAGGFICKRVYEPSRPLPCVRDENGAINEQAVKQLFAKINEELDELKAAVLREVTTRNNLDDLADGVDDDTDTDIAEEAADVITAITTLLEALGIDAGMRDEAQRKVNAKNRERGRL